MWIHISISIDVDKNDSLLPPWTTIDFVVRVASVKSLLDTDRLNALNAVLIFWFKFLYYMFRSGSDPSSDPGICPSPAH